MELSDILAYKSLKQVEEMTGIKADNLRQRINRGTLEAVKIGRDWFISEKTIIDHLRNFGFHDNKSSPTKEGESNG